MTNRRQDLDLKKEEITKALEEGVPRAEICRKYKCKYETLKSRIDSWNLSHLKNPQRKGMFHQEIYLPSSHYTCKDGPKIQSSKLREKLLRDKVKSHECEICKLQEWCGKPIPLELDHINGDHWDNQIENLRLLCPNCHSQTDTNSGKNIGKYKI